MVTVTHCNLLVGDSIQHRNVQLHPNSEKNSTPGNVHLSQKLLPPPTTKDLSKLALVSLRGGLCWYIVGYRGRHSWQTSQTTSSQENTVFMRFHAECNTEMLCYGILCRLEMEWAWRTMFEFGDKMLKCYMLSSRDEVCVENTVWGENFMLKCYVMVCCAS